MSRGRVHFATLTPMRPSGRDSTPVTTLTRDELLRARDGTAPTVTFPVPGEAPVTSPRSTSPHRRRGFPPGRRCDTCGAELTTEQARHCSRACRSRNARSSPAGVAPVDVAPVPDGLAGLLEQLPAAVVRVDLASGWSCTRL